MKKLITYTAAILLVGAIGLGASARNIRNFFINEPENILILLDRNTRLDMLDYWDSGQKVLASTRLSKKSDSGARLIELTDDYISLHTSTVSLVEMKLVKTSKSDTIIVVTQTFTTPAKSGSISFYNTQWQPLDAKKIFSEPTISDFAKAEADGSEVRQLINEAPFTAISYHIDSASDVVVARHDMASVVAIELRDRTTALLNDSITYSFRGAKLRRL